MTEQEQLEASLLQETLSRRKIRGSLTEWAVYLGYQPALHHRFLLHTLERVSRGELRKVMVLMPPGSAKSTYTSMAFPPWFLGQHPNTPILACSCAANLAERFGRACRNIVEQHSKVLGYELAKDSQAAGEWETTNGGRYFCAGVGGKIAGHRAGLGAIDDYLGTQEEADSQTIRDKVWNWYIGDFVPRLWPRAPQVIVANWRHEDDLVGRLIAREKEQWTIIKLPMFAEQNDALGRAPGEMLWPEWFVKDEIELIRSRDPRLFSGLYQQRPAPEEGIYFKADWLVEYRPDDLAAAVRTGMRPYSASDHAVRQKEENDATLLVNAATDVNDNLWILPDWYWGRGDTLTVCTEMIKMAQRHQPIRWWAGSDHITGSIAPFLYKMMQENNIYFPLEEVVCVKDKQAKARSISGRMAQRKVLFPAYAPRWDEVRHELLTFPNGVHDEWVDVLGELGRGLDRMTPASRIAEPKQYKLPEHFVPTIGWVKRSDFEKRRRERARLCDR